MHVNRIVLIVVICLLITGGVVGLMLYLNNKTKDSSTPSPSPSPGGPVLYLLPEVNGFNAPDIKLTSAGYLLDPAVAKSLFPGGIAVIANNADPAGIDAQFNNKKVVSLSQASGLPIRKWISFYFGKDGKWCRCQNGSWSDTSKPDHVGKVQCSTSKKPCPSCTGAEWVPWDLNKCSLCKDDSDTLCLTGSSTTVVSSIYNICKTIPDLEGIMFDDEVGDPTYIIQAIEAVKSMWDKDTGKSLMLGWTGGVSAAKYVRPRNLPGKYTWNVCLGQAYTNTTASYYNDSCTPANSWWSSVASALGDSDADKGVPMVCGAGNCIGDMDGGKYKCYDERLSGDMITKLLNDRPITFKWKNFGIWYGTYSENKGFFGCVNSSCPVDHGCCTGWSCPTDAECHK